MLIEYDVYCDGKALLINKIEKELYSWKLYYKNTLFDLRQLNISDLKLKNHDIPKIFIKKIYDEYHDSIFAYDKFNEIESNKMNGWLYKYFLIDENNFHILLNKEFETIKLDSSWKHYDLLCNFKNELDPTWNTFIRKSCYVK